MNEANSISTTKIIYPQIYAYVLPNRSEDNGWIKIGYTERENVDVRIKEQTSTAAFTEPYRKLWTEPAKFNYSDKYFKDQQLHSYLQKFKHVKRRVHSEWFYYDGNPDKAHQDFEDFINNKLQQSEQKLTYKLRDEQEQAVKTTIEYFNLHFKGEFLWNAKPRFGKTLTTYDLIRRLQMMKVLIVTNRPAIANSWFDDFEKFIAWHNEYCFISTSESLKDRAVLTREQYLKNLDSNIQSETMGQITFISLQDLKGSKYFGGMYDKLKWVRDLQWNLLVIDEAHEGVDTLKTDVAFDKIKRDFTLYLSGTPFKAIASGKFKEEQIYNWTYADEQQAKIRYLVNEENNPYRELPRLNLFSYQMSKMITAEVEKGAQIGENNIDYAFDLNEFFATDDDEKFIHEKDVKKWLNSLTHNEKYPFSTPELRNELKHTFWILNRVNSARALQRLLKRHPVFENYEIILAVGNDKGTGDDQVINQNAFNRVKNAIKNYNKTITISVGQLTTGVTIPEWTGILMLSNIKSSSLYMQAAFRSQNPWIYKENDKIKQKENAYVFDFAPERTLQIYDEFANNLLRETSNGLGTSQTREKNIRQLLNFFPVIAEDDEGKMVKLNVNQILTIPKSIKAKEVVKRGFMCNLLFKNISRIFTSEGARAILEKIKLDDTGKFNSRKTKAHIDIKGIQIDENGKSKIETNLVNNTINSHFGDKVYSDILSKVQQKFINNKSPANSITETFTECTQESIMSIAKEQNITSNQADRVLNSNAHVLGRTIEKIQKLAEIDLNDIKDTYDKDIISARSKHDENRVAEVKISYEAKKKEIEGELKHKIITIVKDETPKLARKSTEILLQKAADKTKNIAEENTRVMLRRFTRTIPSFLMAYGNEETKLENFDQTIDDDVFWEVTGITLAEFRDLRDQYQFFNQIVFDESVQEFLTKRQKLANYFDENQDEDIFDYIPPQKRNQIFTPKTVVKMIIDKLEKENKEIFHDPNKTFADLYIKSGLFIAEIVKRLFIGLKDVIPDKDERLKHILEKQVYGFAPSKIIYFIAKNFIFGFDENAKKIDSSHLVYLDTKPYAKNETEISFEEKCKQLFGGSK